MKVMRKVMFKTNDLCIGDQINVKISGMGKFTATVQKIFEDGKVLFLFDDCIAKRRMNATNTNRGGFAGSELYDWLKNTVVPAFPTKLRYQLCEIGIPSFGMMFGHDSEFYKEYFDADSDEQLELMKCRRNRIADFGDEYTWYWLSNATNDKTSSAIFCPLRQQWPCVLRQRFGLLRRSPVLHR